MRPALGDLPDGRVPVANITSCPPDIRTTAPVDTLEIDLRFAAFITCRTDLVVPDTVPWS